MSTSKSPGIDIQALTAHLEAQLPRYVEDLRALCAFDCFSANKPGVDTAGAWVERWAQSHDMAVDIRKMDQVGNTVLVRLEGKDPKGLRVLLVAHLDTVYPVGVAIPDLRRNDDQLLAPGIADNKSGLLSGLYAMAALRDIGAMGLIAEICLVCGGDEETDMATSGAVLRELAPKYNCALVLEAARANGDIVGARKGVGQITLTVTGRAAHAGVEPQKGRNAIVSLAQMVAALHKLNGVYPEVTVNTGRIHGGTAPNVVPDQATAEIDVRYTTPEGRAAIENAIADCVREQSLAGTSAHMTSEWIAPMPRSPQIARLVDIAQACAHSLGIQVSDAATGGVSYANLLAGAGLPVLDGLGPIGGDDHNSEREYILAPSIVPRTALLALLLYQMSINLQPHKQ